jgi:hypothetical protein
MMLKDERARLVGSDPFLAPAAGPSDELTPKATADSVDPDSRTAGRTPLFHSSSSSSSTTPYAHRLLPSGT